MKTVAAMKLAAKGILWPSGEAPELESAHNAFFVEAMMELQKWCSLLKLDNTTVTPPCASYYDCGLSLVEAPRGIIRKVYTIANGDWCSKIFYSRRTHDAMLCYQKSLQQTAIAPSQTRSKSKTLTIGGTSTVQVTNTILPVLPMGIRFSGPDSDSTWGRAYVGIWSLFRKRIYLGPWVQSNESVVVEWDGTKNDWSDFDILNDWWTVTAERAIRAYVAWRHENEYGCLDRQVVQQKRFDYGEALADAIQENDELLKEFPERFCPAVTPTLEQQAAEAIPASTASDVTDAFMADIGDTVNTTAVKELVDTWLVNRLATGGDNVYLADYVTSLADNFQTYVDNDEFKPSWGNHDWDNDADLLGLIQYTKAPGNYYSFVSGEVEYFMVSSDPREPAQNYVDATTSTASSEMGQWLQAKLAMSTATWKVVIFHHSPYTSGNRHGPSVWMQWPFGDWGADVVLSGHDHIYERLEIDDFPYIVCGVGGQELSGFGAPIEGSIFRDSANFGALKIVSNCNTLTIGFYGTSGILIDELVLNA